MKTDTNKLNPTYEIRQNGKTVLRSDCEFSLPMIFNNLNGKTISEIKEEYSTLVELGHNGYEEIIDENGFFEFIQQQISYINHVINVISPRTSPVVIMFMNCKSCFVGW